MLMRRRRRSGKRSEEVPQVVLTVPGEQVGVVPVDQVSGGVVVRVRLSVRSHRQSPGTAVVFIRSTLEMFYIKIGILRDVIFLDKNKYKLFI